MSKMPKQNFKESVILSNAQTYIAEARTRRADAQKMIKVAEDYEKDAALKFLEYRIASAVRVLNYIYMNRKLKQQDIDLYICHCINKLNGNIDDTLLSLDDEVEGD